MAMNFCAQRATPVAEMVALPQVVCAAKIMKDTSFLAVQAARVAGTRAQPPAAHAATHSLSAATAL